MYNIFDATYIIRDPILYERWSGSSGVPGHEMYFRKQLLCRHRAAPFDRIVPTFPVAITLLLPSSERYTFTRQNRSQLSLIQIA